MTGSLDYMVYSDSKWLEFILGQLLTNAVKYSKHSGAQIELAARRHDNSVMLSVSDNGIGIP